ncbi:MAG: SAM-dependent methyltransferase, partial [Spirochaetia bacterium]|nr:SAM-dependent methyltransferase [Spirochaetia bacterium]
MVRLSERLLAIASCIKKGESIADIGTDHGLLPIFLHENDICSKYILCDINEGPLLKARENIERHILGAPMDLRLGDGFSLIDKGECDCAVIAGMGGKLIISILENDMDKTMSFKKLILQPRNAQEKLREWLYTKGFTILDEHLAREGRYICEIIVATRAGVGLEEESKSVVLSIDKDLIFEISNLLIIKKDPLIFDLIQQKINIERDILSEIYRGGGGKSDRLPDVQRRLDLLEKLLQDLTLEIPCDAEIKDYANYKGERKTENGGVR